MRSLRALRSAVAALIAGTALSIAHPCSATTIDDPSDDILDTYIGQVGPDLDILQFTAAIQDDNLLLQVLLNGAPGTTAGAKYNIAIDRGAGTNTFPDGFKPEASLDAAINVVPGTQSGDARLFEDGVIVTTTPLPPGAFTISGNRFSVVVPLSMLPSTGFDAQDFTFMLWSRTQLAAGMPVQFGIADFAPDHGSLSLVPESSTWALMVLGFATILLADRYGRKARSEPMQAPALRVAEIHTD